MTLLPVIAVLLGLVTVLVAVPLILARARRAHAASRPQDLHNGQAAPVPRLGGVALVVAFVATYFFVAIFSPEQFSNQKYHPVILISCLAMFALGFIDDLKPLGARKKLLGQVIISLVICAFGMGIQMFIVPFTGHTVQLGPWGVLITVLWLVGTTNLINLIDGADGLAAGISLMLMVLLGYVGHKTGNLELLAAGMGGALLAFLCFNFPPARIYMGDGGAYLLGFQIGLFSLLSSHKGEVFTALAAPLFVLALPIVDTALAILRRWLRGLPLFRPDRRHLHHQLLETGMSRTKVVLSFYGVTLVFLALGIMAYWSRGHLVPILLGFTVLILLLCAGQFKFSRRWFAVGRMVNSSLGMRQEIEYALCLSKWLALEGRRQRDIESLWDTLVMVADKLGFLSAKLTLADGERVWSRAAQVPTPSNPLNSSPSTGSTLTLALRSIRHDLVGGRFGVLEFTTVDSKPEVADAPGSRQRGWSRPAITDDNLFKIVTELVAEGWVKAATHYINGDAKPLLFSSEAVARGGGQLRSHALTPVLAGLRAPATPSFVPAENHAANGQLLNAYPNKLEARI
jgi:UDP-GlcNAc:undecaprenyl-phosphate GlcNAc-1-phosphate transferase